MKVSVFTPLYRAGNPYIQAAYESLCAQTHEDWEWVILLNNGGAVPIDASVDPRVSIRMADSPSAMNGWVGALKSEACSHCTGEILFELDHDDLLHPDALAKVVRAVEDGADFVYSDFAEFHTDTWQPNPYSSQYGWQHYLVHYQGHTLVAMRAPDATPQNLRSILWAPNHLRAWRRSFYESLPGLSYPGADGVSVPFVGGHDPSLRFADDHDLIVRTFLHGGRIVRVPECLYFYRVHPEQNCNGAVGNAAIQEWESRVYDRYVYELAERFADDTPWPKCTNLRLAKLDLCGGHDCPERYTPIDLKVTRADGITADLNDRWPVADSSVGVLRAFDAIEHLRDPVHTMNEAYRVLAPGGMMLIRVPSTEGPGAWCDPTHVSFWNRLSFRYYSDRQFMRYVSRINCRFQVARLIRTGGEIPYVVAELVALKPGFEPMGEVRC